MTHAGDLAAHHVQVTATAAMPSALLSVLIGLLPLLLIGGLLYFGVRNARRPGLGGLGRAAGLTKARARVIEAERPATRFADVAGYPAVKTEISEVVDYLRNPGRYHAAGARGPRGVRLTRGEASTGAADDLASATALATQMVCQYGLGTIGPVSYTPLPRAIPASAATPSTPNGSSTRKSPPSWPAPRPALWSYSPATSTPSQSSPPPCSATRPSPATRYAPSPAEPPPAGRMNRILLLSVLVISR